MGFLQQRAQQRVITLYMGEIMRLARIRPPQTVREEFIAEDMAHRHRSAFEMALHEVGLRRFDSPAEVQALEQVCIGQSVVALGMPAKYVPTGGWPAWGN